MKRETLKLRKIIQITTVSNVFEWYEYIVFAFLYTAIGQHFFSSSDPVSAAIETFGVFALSYLARPFGSVFFGWLSDHASTSKAARISMLMMAFPPIAIIVIPSYESIGIIAPVLLVLVRLIQGFAAGGELPVTATFAYNHTEPKFKRLACALVNCSSLIGVLLSSLTITVMNATLTQTEITAGAWKYPFYFSIPLMIFLFWLRKDLALMDKKHPVQKSDAAPVHYLSAICQHKRAFMTGFVVIASLQISFYLMFIWLPTYLQLFLNVPKLTASAFNTLSILVMVATVILTGLALIRFDGRKVLFHFFYIEIVAVIALFYWLIQDQSDFTLATISIIFSVLIGVIDAIALSFIGSLFQSQVRGIGMNVTFTLPAVFFGGFSPLIATWLIHHTGILMIPALMIGVVLLVSLILLIQFEREPDTRQAYLHQN
ncbi:Proline/betaine transporter [Vibrio aerogenes CECT 7868]|uniref:Proline/betaine transporter n=1 Tax=Vibrio aerogenes CECT 7868 TaxID=1216006 RepID=A0A1M6AEC7_9VIBR|nr:MFS transporter [Vibrio aerogenes]SHI34890.1 Proline/betaine transporter [Vibrio aerogenes CECT 7868]